MPDDSSDLLAGASGVLRRFAATTNLLIPGRRFAVHGSGPRSDALAAALVALGARRVDACLDGVDGEDGVHDSAGPGARTEGAPDYLFATGEGVAPLRLDAVLGLGRGPMPLVLVDAGQHQAAVDVASLGVLRTVRPGVLAVGAPDPRVDAAAALVFLVATAGGHRPDSIDPGDAGSEAATEAAAARIRWARRFMPISTRVAADLADAGVLTPTTDDGATCRESAGTGRGSAPDARDGIRIGVSMVLEPKTAVLALLLRDAGADVSVFAHPDETDDAVAAELAREGVPVFARSDASPQEHRALALEFLDTRPQLLLDDGSHLIRLAHTDRPEVLSTMLAAAEETTSGVRPLRLMAAEGALAIPVVSVNDARSKTLFDNLYGTGQACVFAIVDLLESIGRADLSGRMVAIAGFGPVGQGVARTVTALGGRVVVSDPDPVRALQAAFGGYRVAPLVDAVADADLVISASGVADTISTGILRTCAPDAVVAVAGGVPHEVALDEVLAGGAPLEPVARKIDRLRLAGGAGVLLLDRGGCINITAGEGNPIDIMDLSFAVQLSAVRFLLDPATRLGPGVHPLPMTADDRVAAIALTERGVSGDARSDVAGADDGWASRRFVDGQGAP